MRARWIALILILVHMAFAAVYAWVTPYRTPGLSGEVFLTDIGAPDELSHSLYVQHLAEGKGLPMLIKGEKDEIYEAHQPPLYYAVTAVWSKIVGVSDFTTHASGFKLRLLNVLFGGLAIAGICAFAWWGYGRKDILFLAGALAALLPMNVSVSSAISNDPLLFVCGAWMIAYCVKAVREGWCLAKALMIGLFTGMGLLTKTSAIVFCLPFFVTLLLSTPRPKLSVWSTSIVLGLLLVAPLWIRNYQVYHDPLMVNTFNKIWLTSNANGYLSATSPRALAHILLVSVNLTTLSFVGLFGYMCIKLPLMVYLAAWFLIGFCVWGWIKESRVGNQEANKAVNRVGGSFIIAALLAYIAFNMNFMQPQARYMFYALGPLVVILAFGLQHWFRRRFVPVSIALALALMVVNIIAIGAMKTDFKTMQQDLAEAGGRAAFEK